MCTFILDGSPTLNHARLLILWELNLVSSIKMLVFFLRKSTPVGFHSFVIWSRSSIVRSAYLSNLYVDACFRDDGHFPVMAFCSNVNETVILLNCLASSSLANPSLHEGLLSKSLIRAAICSGKSFCSVSYPVVFFFCFFQRLAILNRLRFFLHNLIKRRMIDTVFLHLFYHSKLVLLLT